MKIVGGKKRKLIIGNEKPWSDLPYEILELIKKRLFFIDQVNFRAVCKSWSCIERVPPLQQMPWLLVFDDNSNDDNVSSYKLVDSKYKKTYNIDVKAKLKMTNFDYMKVHESKYGWLLVSQSNHQNDTRFFLYSPFFSGEHNLIELPVLMNCSILCATFTCNPLEEDCKILTLHRNDHDNTNNIFMKTYRCGQGSWSSQKFDRKFEPLYNQHWIYSEGSFYYETINGGMVKFNLALEEWTVSPTLPSTDLGYYYYYKVKSSDGELFLIRECNLNETHRRWHYDSRIYRLNLSSMIWEDLDSIGDRVLFFGEGYNSVLHSSVLKLNGERNDISDKIYYCKQNELRYCSVHDYTLKFSKNEKPPRKQNCLRHYGSIATKRCCRKMLIDPPPR